MSDSELDDVADDLDASTDAVGLAMDQRRSTLEALEHLKRVGGKLLQVAETVAIQAAIVAIQGALTKGQ